MVSSPRARPRGKTRPSSLDGSDWSFAAVLILRPWLNGFIGLGLFDVARFQAGCVESRPGNVLAVCTDGVTEAFNDAGEEFAEERLVDIIRSHHQRDPETMYHAVVERVRQWQGNLKQHDDITLLIAKVDGGPQ